ncbi:MAG: glycosyltransferase family 2 protein [Pseudomonadota bacterium]
MTRNLKEFVNQTALQPTTDEGYGAGHVAVLLAHYNGGPHFEEQLRSLSGQSHQDWSLIVSDDGSSDAWLETAASFAASEPDRRVWLMNGPQQGFARNFLSLLAIAGPSVPHIAFCDQDDVWLPTKLGTAVAALADLRPGLPAIYCGRTTICDQQLTPSGPSPCFRKPPGFANALTQNIGGGNTMVLNRAAIDLVQDTLQHAQNAVSHDWWCYQLVTGAGGRVIYDTKPHVLYRQHDGNRIGANASLLAKLRRLRALLSGEFRAWNDKNLDALRKCSHWLTPDARDVLTRFDAARQERLLSRIAALKASGVHRQTASGQIALWLACLLKKL